MKRYWKAAAFLSALILIAALVSLSAFAEQGDTAVTEQSGATGTETGQDGETVQATCTDRYLYDALLVELGAGGQNVIVDSDGETLSVRISSDKIADVKSLRLNNRYISDISGLEAFSALEELNIANNMIANLAPLSQMARLSSLDACGNQVRDISPLLGLAGLRHLSLAKNALKDDAKSSENSIAAQISVLTSLEELDLSHNSIRYTNGLEKLTNLTRLELYSNYIRDISGLEGLSRLAFLNLGENNETNTSTIAGLSALKSLRALQWLDFSQGYTPDLVSYISGLTELEYLCLNQNQIVDIGGLANLTKLRELELAYNQITSIDPLLGLSNLEYLSVQNNKILTLEGIIKENTEGTRELVWPVMKKLDTVSNWGANDANGKNHMWRSTELLFLRELYQDQRLEWHHDYNPVYDPAKEGLPHTDEESGVKYVTYEDFGARCDGVFDDYIAMRNAHNFANSYAKNHPQEQMEVRGVPGKTYHYFNELSSAVTINTNVDWRGATIAIHDEHLERRYGRSPATRVFRLSNTDSAERIILSNPDNPDRPNELSWTIGTETKSLADRQDVMDALSSLIEKGQAKGKTYDEFFCIVQNADHRQFVRFGSNANGGEPQQDRFKMDAQGNLLNDVIWNFEKITSFEIFPVAKEPFVIQNAHILTYGAESLSEEVQSRSGKNIYWYRHLCFSGCSNVLVRNIRHTVEPDEIGSYYGIIELNNVVDAEIRDCTFFAHKCNNRSTYDFTVNSGVNLRFVHLDSNDIMDRTRWGITGMNYLKDVVYENCRLNHADVHQGAYNWTIRDSEIGTICLIGRGSANIINTTLYDDDFIELRQDYGTTFDGNINIIDCTLHYWGKYIEALMKSLFAVEGDHIHKFGYDLRFPNVYVENLTIDSADAPDSRNYMVLLTNWSGQGAAANDKAYWPDSLIVNGYRFVNSDHLTFSQEDPALRFTASNEGQMEDVNFILTDCRLKLEDETRTDITSRVFQGECVTADSPVTVTVQKNDSAENTLEVFRDGVSVLPAAKVEDYVEQTFREAGDYRVILHSHQVLRYWGDTGDGKNGWNYYDRDGDRELCFTVTGTPSEGTKIISVERTDSGVMATVFHMIPNGTGTNPDTETITDPDAETITDPNAAIFCGFYSAEEELIAIQSEFLRAGENSYMFAIDEAYDYAEVFLLNADCQPFSNSVRK